MRRRRSRAIPTPFRSSSRCRSAFDIFKDKAHFRLVGSVATTLELPCGRCLEPFTLPVDASFDLRYQPHAANTGEGEREIEEDDLSTAFYENETIDLGQLMREQFYLALPMKPLCGEDCRGLCTAVRDELEPRDLQLHARLGGSEARGAEGAEERRSKDTGHESSFAISWSSRRAASRSEENTCRIPNDDTPRPGPPSAGRTTRSTPVGHQRMPALPRAEAAAPRVRQLRVLPRPPGAGRSTKSRSWHSAAPLNPEPR